MLSAFLQCQAEVDLASFITLLSEDIRRKAAVAPYT